MENDNTIQYSKPYQYNNISNTRNPNISQTIEPLKPTAKGSANYIMKKQVNMVNQVPLIPSEINTVPQDSFIDFPQHRVEMQEYSQSLQALQPHQTPTNPSIQQNTYRNNSYNLLQHNQSVLPQNTANTPTDMMTQQSTYPLSGSTNSNHLNPQYTTQLQPLKPSNNVAQSTIPSSNLLSVSNVAGIYFQSLLSHTLSPNGSNTILRY